MEPLIDKVVASYEGKVTLLKIQADDPDNEDLVMLHNVNSLPTLVLERGNETMGYAVGTLTEQELRKFIDVRLELIESEY